MVKRRKMNDGPASRSWCPQSSEVQRLYRACAGASWGGEERPNLCNQVETLARILWAAFRSLRGNILEPKRP